MGRTTEERPDGQPSRRTAVVNPAARRNGDEMLVQTGGRGASIELVHHGGHRMSSETPAGSPPDDSQPLESQVQATLVATMGDAEVSAPTEARAPGEAPSASDEAPGPAATEPAVPAAEAGPSAEAAPAPASDPATHRFECRSCGFVYDPAEGVRKLTIEAGTPFLDLDPGSFRCPVCRSRVGAFKYIGPRTKPSGFEENLNFGLGVNRLTPGQKNVLIFGAFALAIGFFLSLYSLR